LNSIYSWFLKNCGVCVSCLYVAFVAF